MKSHLISAGYQLETYSKYKTANAFAEASKQSKNCLLTLFLGQFPGKAKVYTHTRNVLYVFPLNLPLVLNECILEFK